MELCGLSASYEQNWGTMFQRRGFLSRLVAANCEALGGPRSAVGTSGGQVTSPSCKGLVETRSTGSGASSVMAGSQLLVETTLDIDIEAILEGKASLGSRLNGVAASANRRPTLANFDICLHDMRPLECLRLQHCVSFQGGAPTANSRSVRSGHA